jgi:hypothetical protein
MEVGEWWYVYPREITAASFVLLALLPDLPKAPLAKLACTALIALALWPLGSVMSDAGRKFETDDFDAIVTHIPAAPKLMYLVIDHDGHASRRPLFLHLPAYVQAARGGWLSFHFAVWGASPVVYRPRDEPGAIVPPPVPRRWEWTPQKFRVLEHGQFFDWFLIRRRRDPADLLRDDASLVPVAHEGMWWLYRRAPS